MTYVERLKRQLLSARQTSEKLLADFQRPEQWVYQVHPQSNHALWFVGHMGHSDNFFISLLDPARAHEPRKFIECFGMGSQPAADAAQYPAAAEVMDYMRERRSVLLDLLDHLQDADLEQSTPPGAPDFLRDKAAVFEMAIWHEGLHSGQLSVVRRALGFPPLA